ncbi:MAG: NUDIX domain-containing protein [Bacteroidetes bacterium]|nr:NUDIX domain-containing protein [Bacteroidota bacterium]MDA1120930.1 NUDIX domain-containing protein [Bacteroidota bacterium]
MKIFINDIPVYIRKYSDDILREDYNVIIDGDLISTPSKKLIDDVLVTNASNEDVDHLLKLMTQKKFRHLDAVTFTVRKRRDTVSFIKRKFKVMLAAGGVATNGNKVILIYRHKKWDLPKGKLKKKEAIVNGAVREVEEECNIKVKAGERICTTWHTYLRNGKFILKKTYWYEMVCLDDSKMAPQIGEEIEEVRLMDFDQTRIALYNSYRTVRHVMKLHYKLQALIKA